MAACYQNAEPLLTMMQYIAITETVVLVTVLALS